MLVFDTECIFYGNKVKIIARKVGARQIGKREGNVECRKSDFNGKWVGARNLDNSSRFVISKTS